MQAIPTSQLTPGMAIAKDVYTYSDQLILPAGSLLTDKAITKLAFYSIPFIYIKKDDPVLATQDTEPEDSYSNRIKNSPEFKKFTIDFQADVEKFKIVLNDVVEKNGPLNINELLEDTLALLHNTHSTLHIFDILHNMRHYDDQTYAHSINVALICNVLATWLNMSEEDVSLATQCGLLHDIGKLRIPEVIIKKPAQLTNQEYNIIKTHALEGYNILQKCHVDPHIANAALLHHERCDGSGYPFGLSSSQIDPFAKIVAIADVYEAMTATRVYRSALCPFTVLSLFENEGIQKYDTKYILTFMENVLNTYILNRVRLSDGRKGEVVLINKHALSRPLIRCGDEYIDLSVEPDTLVIEEIL
ncbi:MAG: HD-GYP domain-containing protein [Lachnospiraceae bacterium]|nr:HD-GYP domain-containing protein [Lachnospiraceae bacterium]MDD7025578.1 HD-GYP domain-containing protein [Lachnospiraceae bacterium]